MMKEILLCGVGFKNDTADRRVLLYLNDCDCGRKHCQESAALAVKNHLKRVSLKEAAIEFLIESQLVHESYDGNSGHLVGHIHLNETQLMQSNISLSDVLEKCQETINLNRKKKKVGSLFKRIDLSYSECCSFCQSSKSKWTNAPYIQFFWQGASDVLLERASDILADTVCPVLLQTVIKGDPRVSTANLIWISPDTATWIRSPSKSLKGELAVDITLEKEAVKKIGDAWRVVMDSCLPVFHLIDSQRSIPYAIKQIEHLLGISCAFEQAVQRLDSFTAEEQDVLLEVESLMQNIRRIMHQTGYTDGDRLPADDQTYIVGNVFNYHPDKGTKMGAGLDYIKVRRHSEFQDSRCFYAVSVDGVEADFSYRKCLENFVKEKYTEKADTFNPKYFKKPQPRPGWNRDQRGHPPPRGEAGTPRGWNGEEAGTPWVAQTPGPQSEAGTPSGWGGASTPAADKGVGVTGADSGPR